MREADRDLVIEPEAESQRSAVLALERLAFGRADEAEIVARLHQDGAVLLSLVARLRERVVGHLLFSRLHVESAGRKVGAAALAPLCVDPALQRRGIGSALVREGLARLRERGCEAVIVLGEPAYYRRFGFCAEPARDLQAPFSGPAFMALEFVPGCLGGSLVIYPAAFGLEGA